MKQTIALLLSFLSISLYAQVIEDSTVPFDEMEKAEKEINTSVENHGASNTLLEAFEEAQAEYAKAQEELARTQEAEMQADNALESARVSLRQAKLALNEASKKENPIIIERYDPMITPIYEEMSKGMQPGVAVFIEGSKTDGLLNVFAKNVDKEYKDYLKQYKSGKVRKQKGELFFDNMMIPQISSTNMDVFVDFVKQDNGVSVRTYFNKGSEFQDFTDQDATTTKYVYSLLDQFARYMRTKNLEGELESIQKDLEKTQKNLEKEKDNISGARSDIQKAKQKIAEARGDVSANESAIDDLNDKLELTREKLSKVN